MVLIAPLAGYVVSSVQAEAVAALPYDVFTIKEAADEIANYPESFLRIDRTTALLPELDEYDPQVYQKAKQILQSSIASNQYQQEQNRFYLYRMAWPKSDIADKVESSIPPDSAISDTHNIQIGLMAAVATEDYRNNIIRRHENTRTEKLQDRVDHINTLGVQASPVLMTHRTDLSIKQLHSELMAASDPYIDFISVDDIRHTVWIIDSSLNQQVIQTYQSLDTLYIADGHHRAEAASTIKADGIFAILFPADMLQIHAYNRVVEDLNGLTEEQFLEQVRQYYSVQIISAEPSEKIQPIQRGQIAMHMHGSWYQLQLNEQIRSTDALAALDVSILQSSVLKPLLGIDDPKESTRITYVGGSLGIQGLVQRMATFERQPGEALAFALHAVDMDDFFAVADSGQLMPPKSTWFAPKPRSGIVMMAQNVLQE
ncbi:MAG: DUF1015 family protein [Coriobacteriia bacterium]|nr:DUF1015 family protein [Coriobacteriia bacterium]